MCEQCNAGEIKYTWENISLPHAVSMSRQGYCSNEMHSDVGEMKCGSTAMYSDAGEMNILKCGGTFHCSSIHVKTGNLDH